ncbi:uncharacterized protein FPRN_12016 [Fusarium proliferatum]|nr:uncharacterized protein FPRN_12016 [Fusarium proliferatum]
MRGILRLSQQKSDVCPQLPSSANEVIDCYVYVAEAMKDATTNCGRVNTPALKIGGDRAAMSINQSLQIWPLRAKQHIPYAAESGGTGNVLHSLGTPPNYAPAAGSLAVVNMLLGHLRVNPNSKNDFGGTPLWQAALLGSMLTLRNRNDATPLMEAAKRGHTGVICLLLDMEAVVPDAVDDHGYTVLWYAASRNKAGKSVCGTAVQNGHVAVVRALLTVGGATPDLESPFQAVEKGNLGMVQLMLITGNFKPGTLD